MLTHSFPSFLMFAGGREKVHWEQMDYRTKINIVPKVLAYPANIYLFKAAIKTRGKSVKYVQS